MPALGLFSHITLHKKLTIRVGIDLDLLEASRENIRHLYSIINQNLSIDFVLYDSKDMAKSNLILLKGMFAIQYSLSAHRKAFNMCTYIYDEATVMDIYETFYFVNDKISPLMFPVTTLGLEQLGYRTSFYATNKYFSSLPLVWNSFTSWCIWQHDGKLTTGTSLSHQATLRNVGRNHQPVRHYLYRSHAIVNALRRIRLHLSNRLWI